MKGLCRNILAGSGWFRAFTCVVIVALTGSLTAGTDMPTAEEVEAGDAEEFLALPGDEEDEDESVMDDEVFPEPPEE